MTHTLFHYVHCPFCIRVRMAFGFLNFEYKSVVVPYHDEKTPLELTGKKMLPILKHPGGAMNESLDIIRHIDLNSVFKISEVTSRSDFKELENLLNQLSEPIHSLAMPHFIWTPEFDTASRQYFVSKKEVKRGPFKELVKSRAHYEAQLSPLLESIETSLVPFYKSKEFGLNDLLIASLLWGLYVVPEFQFSAGLHQWLQKIKKICRFNYHEDYWR